MPHPLKCASQSHLVDSQKGLLKFKRRRAKDEAEVSRIGGGRRNACRHVVAQTLAFPRCLVVASVGRLYSSTPVSFISFRSTEGGRIESNVESMDPYSAIAVEIHLSSSHQK